MAIGIIFLAIKCYFCIQNSTQSKYKYDIRNQHASLHTNNLFLRIFEKKKFRVLVEYSSKKNLTLKMAKN